MTKLAEIKQIALDQIKHLESYKLTDTDHYRNYVHMRNVCEALEQCKLQRSLYIGFCSPDLRLALNKSAEHDKELEAILNG